MEQKSIQKKQDVSFLIHIKNDTIDKNGGEFTKKHYKELLKMRYGRLVKTAAMMQLIEEEGVTPEMIEKWGDYDEKEGVMYLTFEVEDITKGVNGSVFLKRRVVRDYSIPLSEI